MSKKSQVWLSVSLVLVLLIGAGAFAVFRLPMLKSTAAGEAARDLAEGQLSSDIWHDSDLAQGLFDRVTKSLGKRVDLRSVTVDDITEADGQTVAELDWTWANLDGEAWRYSSELPLKKNGLFWWADLTEAALHPELGSGGSFELRANPGQRGKILGADDAVLMEEGRVIDIGVHPNRLEPDTLDSLVSGLNSGVDSLDLDADELEDEVDEAEGDQLVSVVTLREDDYEDVKDSIHDLPGVLFSEDSQTLTRTRGFAQATLGSAGPASAEDIEKSQGGVIAGDIVGRTGLQKTFNARLSGPGSVEVFAKGDSSDDSGKTKLTSLHSFEQKDGEDVETTLDAEIQNAADEAAAAAENPAAVVAIRPSSGDVLAVANHDPDGAAWDRGLTGQYAPGSVFKIASGLALSEAGVSPGDDIDCPKTVTVGGKEFKNAEDEVLGDISFAKNFAQSCNTAFVSSGEEVTGDEVADAAAQLGMTGALGIGAKMASVPAADDEVTHAAQMIGQGKVQTSPLSVATMAASVQAGETVTPRLVLGDALEDSGADASDDAAGDDEAPALDEDAAQEISDMMRRAVTEGTATKLKDVPGDPVHGKTGTAEYGDEIPPRTHSWFAGFQGDLAVAVLVEDGGFGAEAAVPVAKEFFDTIN
ncbi:MULTISPECIES: penicillin-binding transpeptidase domain-containing protein [unclassified Brevibacterium]|uniref:penicillin-binding transpeptidase domain-containing protein n=1 Tax=unclassified Brevibacterium TaxID=2614124 RepID=UPI001BAB6DB8|nr:MULTISPECIES: penicillin-binding transpeptidase domain-containing protein [unclassified Brevibacterium]QUL79066.1 cell division protein FtsI [Brevibacterium sp. SMBL_HHYL_HB1]